MIQVYPARSRTKDGCLNYSAGIKSGQEGDHCSVCTCPHASFPLHGSSSPSLTLWWGFFMPGGGLEQKWGSCTLLIEPLPGLLAAWPRCEVAVFLVFRVTWVLRIDVCVERRFVCVLAELFLSSFKIFPPGFVFFLNYTNDFFFGMCVRKTLKPLLISY